MGITVDRKGAVGTFFEAFGWLQRHPILVPAFFVVGIVEGLGEASALFGLLAMVLTVFADGVTHRLAYAEAAGRRTTIDEEVGPVLERLLSLLGALVVYVAAIVVGLFLLILPGIYLGLRLALTFPAIVIDDQRALEGLSTSWEVARGNLLKILGITVLAIVAALSTLIVAAVFTVVVDSPVFLVLVSAVVTGILSPVVQLAYARIYLENRRDGRQPGASEYDEGPKSAHETAGSWNSDDQQDGSSWDDDRDSFWDDERDRSNS